GREENCPVRFNCLRKQLERRFSSKGGNTYSASSSTVLFQPLVFCLGTWGKSSRRKILSLIAAPKTLSIEFELCMSSRVLSYVLQKTQLSSKGIGFRESQAVCTL
ncbi:unnamed protein product, partial [Allacma fusca]